MNLPKFAARVFTVACLVVLLSMASVASACPSCQAALANDSAQGDLARGIYYSIMFMLSMPFAIIGTFGCLAYRAVRREQRRVASEQQAQAAASETPVR